MEQELSIELSWEELEKIITNYGFKIEVCLFFLISFLAIRI